MKIQEILIEAVNLDMTLERFNDKIEFRKKQDHSTNELSNEEILKRIISSDPTTNQKYVLKWILPRYLTGGIRYLEDLSRTKTALSIFDKNKARIETKDIQQIKTLSDLEDITEPFSETKSQNDLKKEEKAEIYKETNFVYKGPEGILLSPLTERSSCFWGKGTKWCTAATNSENMFEYYNDKGPLYIVIVPSGAKYQFHLETNSFMDEKDKEINWERLKFFVYKITENIPDEQRIEIINKQLNWFEYFENPSEQLCLHAINRFSSAIRHVKHQTKEMQMLAVHQNGNTLKYIHNPGVQVQKLAVRQNGNAIYYIKNPSEDIQYEAVKQCGKAISFIKNPSEKIQHTALESDAGAIRYIENPSEKIQLKAIERRVNALLDIRNPTIEVLKYAVIHYFSALYYIEKPSEEIIQLAVKHHGKNVLKYL